MKQKRLLIILTRNPEAGMVKTRLAKSIGDEKALEIYEKLRCHTASVAEKVNSSRMVFYSRTLPSSDIFLNKSFTAALQNGADLGERMLHAIQSGFEKGFGHIVLIGTDCLELTPATLEEAFTALEEYDAVLGPAVDGGFYLIGMNRPIEELFLGREWSRPDVLQKTTGILQKQAIPYRLLSELSDIDTFEDLVKSGLWQCNQ